MWIPYDSSLVLGNLLDESKLVALQEVAQLKQGVDTAQDSYNAQLRNKLSMDMSLQEMESLKINVGANAKAYEVLLEKRDECNENLMKSLMSLIDARMEFETQYTEMMKSREQTLIGAEPESPIKFAESTIQDLPLSSDSLKMDVQYFRKESGSQGSRSHVKQVSSYVAAAVNKGFGAGLANKTEGESQDHMHQQTETNKLVGTLVITARATHKNAKVYDAKYDAKKLVRAWNAKVPDDQICLPGNLDELHDQWSEGQMDDDGADAKKIAILTGQTYGSSFVGFVHFLKTSHHSSYERTRKKALTVQAEATYGNFLATVTGKFGLDRSTASNIKSLMSSNKISSHVSIMTHGIVPTIASQNVTTALKKFSEFNGAEMNGKLCTLASGKDAKATTVDGKARSNILAGKITSIERAKIDSVLSGVANADEESNSVLNMNSMMQALDDYVKNIRDADGGVPVNFFVTTLKKSDVVGEWIKEFRPNMYNKAMSGENEEPEPEEDSDDEDEQEERKKKRY